MSFQKYLPLSEENERVFLEIPDFESPSLTESFSDPSRAKKLRFNRLRLRNFFYRIINLEIEQLIRLNKLRPICEDELIPSCQSSEESFRGYKKDEYAQVTLEAIARKHR
jgi:hypothetical protein